MALLTLVLSLLLLQLLLLRQHLSRLWELGFLLCSEVYPPGAGSARGAVSLQRLLSLAPRHLCLSLHIGPAQSSTQSCFLQVLKPGRRPARHSLVPQTRSTCHQRPTELQPLMLLLLLLLLLLMMMMMMMTT
jgi:hypothetical protein